MMNDKTEERLWNVGSAFVLWVLFLSALLFLGWVDKLIKPYRSPIVEAHCCCCEAQQSVDNSLNEAAIIGAAAAVVTTP